MNYPHLFSPGRIGTLELKNRLVMPPMVRNYADANGMVTERYVRHIDRIAQGGVGMMILEASFIRPDGRGFTHELGIHTDETVPGLKKLAQAAHAHDAKIGVQLYHAGRQTSSHTTGVPLIAPSEIADPTEKEVPHAMSVEEIRTVVEAFADAARRAKEARMDFVEIHGAHGYLVTQFFSPFSNQRTDDYGGSFENRMRFANETYAAVREAVGKDFCVTMRLSGDEMVEGGLRIEDTVAIAQHLEKLGVDGLHISVGNYASYAQGYMIAPMAMPDGVILHLAEQVKHAVGIPVIAVGKLRTPEEGEQAISDGSADFIAIGRTLLADPEWPNKVRDGRTDEINYCVACNQGCISRLFAQQDVWCTVNPACGREAAFAEPAKTQQRVLVIGGGPAGLSAAITAAERGHRVELYESSDRLGGQLAAAGAAPHRGEWVHLRDSLERRVQKLNITVHLNTPCTPERLQNERFDLAVVATGSVPLRPASIPGISGANVTVARDVLEGRAEAKGSVVVIGGGCAGAQTAEYLADKGHAVTIVEMKDAIATDAPSDDGALLLGRLNTLGVQMLTQTAVTQIEPDAVVAGKKRIPADTVVVCLGSHPQNDLEKTLHGIAKKIAVVGDAKQARRVTDAIIEGALAVIEP